MKILVIPEDFRKDQYMLKPIIEKMLKLLFCKSQAKIIVCRDPVLRGVSQALNFEKIEEIITRYYGMDMFLLCVDRDGQATKRAKLDNLEEKANELLSETKIFFAENAWQEIEVWVLAGHSLPSEWNWNEIRQESNPNRDLF